MHGSAPSSSSPRQTAHERVLLPLGADRRGLAVAGVDPGLGRQLHQLVHHRGLQIGEPGRARGARAADGALEEDVGGEHVGAVEGERAVVGAVARRVDDLDPQGRRSRSPTPSANVSSTSSSISSAVELVGEDRCAEALGQRPGADHVVVVVVGEQQVGDLDPLALGALGERVGDRVRVDQHPLAARLVERPGRRWRASRIVRRGSAARSISSRTIKRLQPTQLNSITLRIPSWASISSKPRLTSSSVIRWEMNGSTSISPAR